MPIQAPFGDIFFVQTPVIDRTIAQLQQEQQRREQMGYQDYLATQQALQKEFANVRSADIPDLVKAYNDYKQIRQGMLFDKKIQSNPVQYAQAQQMATQKLSEAYNLIGMSKEQKDLYQNMNKDFLSNHDQYADNFAPMMADDNRKPTMQLIQEGKNSPAKYLYAGSNTDFTPVDKAAQGEIKTTAGETQLTPDGLQFIDNAYKHGNSPSQYLSVFKDALAKHGYGRDAQYLYKNIPDEQKQQVQESYNNISDDVWKKWGVPKQDLQQANGLSDAEKYAIYKAQVYALSNEPQADKPTYRINTGALEDLKLKNQKIMEGIRQGHQLDLLAARHQYKQMDEKQQDTWLNDFINNDQQFAQKNPREYINADGTKETQYSSGNPIAKSAFKIDKFSPDDIRYLKNGNVLLLYYQYKPDPSDPSGNSYMLVKGANGKIAVDKDKTQQISREQYKVGLGKVLVSKKDLGVEMNDEGYDGLVPDNEADETIPDFLRK